MKERTADKTKCYKIEVDMYLRKYFLQNDTPEIGSEILVFIKQFVFQKSCGLKHSILRPSFIPLNLILRLS